MEKSAKGLNRFVVRMFAFLTVFTVLVALLSGFQLSQLEGGASSEQIGHIDRVVQVSSWIWTSILLIAVISLYVWVYQSTKRCVSRGAAELKYSPTMAVVWMFIPIVNLVMFGRIFQQLYKASKDPRGWSEEVNSPLVRTMWIWMINNFLFSQVASHLSSAATTFDSVVFAITLSILSDVVQIIFNIQVIRVVKMISSLQDVSFTGKSSDSSTKEIGTGPLHSPWRE